MFSSSFLIYRLEKYLVSNGFQVSDSTTQNWKACLIFFGWIPFHFIFFLVILSATRSVTHHFVFLTCKFLSFSLIISYYYLVSYEFQVNALTTQYWLLARNLLLLCPLSNTAHEIVFFLEIVANVSFVLLKGIWLL